MSKRIFIIIAVFLFFGFVGLGVAWAFYSAIDDELVYQALPDLTTDLGSTVSSYLLTKPADRLPLSAGAYVVSDLETKEIIIGANDEKVLPIASVTKLVTALVAKELLAPTATIIISQKAYNTYGNTGGFRVGEKIALSDAYYPLLLSSSNDIAEALAETAGREKFITRMNKLVEELGMTDTHFDDPSGLSPDNVSSSDDLVKLIAYIYKNHQGLLTITREKQYRLGRHTWRNLNNVSLMKYYVGGKNGYTEEANRTLVSLFEVPITVASTTNEVNQKKTRLLAVVLLQSSDRKNDTKKIVDYLSRYAFFNGGKNGFEPIN